MTAVDTMGGDVLMIMYVFVEDDAMIVLAEDGVLMC